MVLKVVALTLFGLVGWFLNDKLGSIDKRFEKADTRFESMERKQDELYAILAERTPRISMLETEVRGLSKSVDRLADKVR